jgi:hypothetical protein
MLIGVSVATWYTNESTFSAELMDSFVKGIEKQAAESIARYETHSQTHVLEDATAPAKRITQEQFRFMRG